jgi:uncharacterized protein YraI
VLQVIIEDTGGALAPSNAITVYVLEGETSIDTPAPAEGDTDTPTPTTTFTPTTDEPQVTADQNVNCRKGPSSAYNEAGALLQGQTAPITGRNQDSTWYQVDLEGIKCWVWSGAVTVTGDASEKPVVAAPPLPVTVSPEPAEEPVVEPPPVYSACHDYPDFATCNADPMNIGGCSWNTGLNQCQP